LKKQIADAQAFVDELMRNLKTPTKALNAITVVLKTDFPNEYTILH